MSISDKGDKKIDKHEEVKELIKEINEKIEEIEKDADDITLKKIDAFREFLKSEAPYHDVDENINNLKEFNQGLSRFQRVKQSFQKDVSIDPSRLLGLTDGIFGMVMTLLIFAIGLPEIQINNFHDFLSFVTSLAPTIGITLVSFVLLGSFWIYHHEFLKINKLDIPFLWLNIFYLACISFIPFTTSVLGNYSYFLLSELIFGLNIFLVILTFSLMYRYAYKRNFLERKPSDSERRYVIHTFFIIMIFSIIASVLGFFVSGYFIYLFLLIPVISTYRDIHFEMNA